MEDISETTPPIEPSFEQLPAPQGLTVRTIRAYLPGETGVGLRATWEAVPGAAHYAITVSTRAGGTVRIKSLETQYEFVADPALRYCIRTTAVSINGTNGVPTGWVVTVPCIGNGEP